MVIFFFASAGASAAYLTASEVFPMETRALCIAFFYAIGTAAGGISGPLLFGKLIDGASADKDITADRDRLLHRRGADDRRRHRRDLPRRQGRGQTLEDIAKPLTAEDSDTGTSGTSGNVPANA